METSKLISRIKISHLPCYLSDNESAPTPLYADSITFHEFKQLNYHSFPLESLNQVPTDVAVSLQCADCPSVAKLPESASFGVVDKRTLVSKLGRAVRGYLRGDSLDRDAGKRKVKCASLEKITPDDLCLFYRYKYSAQQIKRTCDINLWLLLEKTKELFRAIKKDSIQTLLEDLSRLIVNFISSSDSDLHFTKCKYILDRLEELENIIHDRFNINYLSTSSPSLSLSVIPSLKTVHSTPNAETFSKNTPEAFNKGQSNSLKNVNTASTTILKNSPVKPSNSANDDEEKFAYKQILSIIAKAKYTMAQMGHLLHYDRLANPNIEQLYPKDFKKKWENNTIPSPPGRGRRKRSDSQTFASFSTAIDVNLASIDLDTEKQTSSINEINTTEDLSHCSNLMRFFYCTQTFLEDFEENVVNRRKEALGKYCLWKIRKWALKYKKDKVEQKYQESELVCKICAQKVKTDKLKEHSGYCRKIAELDKELKDLELKLGDAINDTCMRSKELRTQLLVMKNEYQRLKRRNCAKSAQNSISFLSSLNFKHMKRNMSNGSVGSIDDNNTSIIDLHAQTARDIHENSFGAYEEEQQQVRGRKHGSSGEFRLKLACQEDIFTDTLNESFGPKDDNETRFKSPANIKHSHHKSFVEKILDKYPQKYEGSPSTERFQSPSCGSQKSNKRFASLTEKKKFAELLTKSSRSSKFYSDNGRTDSGEELDSERNVTDDDKARQNSRTNLEAQYSSEGSEALKLGFEMSSSEKSACNSPDMSNNALNTRLTSYKKSKFFLGTGLTYDDKEEEEEEMKEELEVPREEEEEVQEDIPVNEERLARLVQEKRGTRMRRTTVFMHKDDAMRDVFSGHLDRKITQELSDLRVRIENKKNANTLYEVIKAKGKIMVNQEPYQKSMEMVKDDAFKEINAIKARITDQDVVAFADNFLLALDKRIQTGKKIQETQKALGMLDGKTAEEPLDKALQKKFSLLRGHSSLTLTKRRLNFSSIPAIQPSNTVGEEQVFSLMKANPIKLKARSSHSNKKMFPDAPGEGSMTSLSAEQPVQSSYDFQINDKLKRYVENQQSSLVSLQEEIEDPNVSKGDVSPFGVTNFGQSSFSALEKIVQRTEEKRQSNGQAPFSLDELIANSPRDQTMRSENTDVKVTHSSLITDDSSPNTGTQTTIKESASTFSSKDVNSKTLTITLGNEEIEEKGAEEEAVRSPETPSFEAPMIWRTSTAPARTLANIRKQLVTKANTHDLAHLKDNSSSQTEEQNQQSTANLSNNTVSISSTVAHEGLNPDGTRIRIVPDTRIPAAFEEQDHESDESKSPESNLMSRRILMRQKTKDNLSRPKLMRGFTKVEESFDDDISPGRQLNRVLHRTGSKRFMEDDSMDDIDASPTKKEESPLLIESPLLQRGYYSDSHAKKAPRTLTKQSLIGINDFELIKMISKGAYGRVWLVRRKATNDFYAMKEINLAEKFNKNSKELENLRKENKIFGLAKEDFVVRALFTFIHETCICFVMEYMLGGDFGDILYNYCALEEEVARFYIAEIVLALEYLHSLGIVHRDLKPDNILLDKRGHAKLTDFGLSETGLSRKMAAAGSHNEGGSPSMYQKKEQAIYELCRNKDELDNNINLKLKGKVMERRATMKDLKDSAEDEKMDKNKDQKLKKPHRLIGTPDYMAPEIIMGHSFTDFSIDWFSLGVMLFEFVCGVPPFNDETPEKIYDNITKLKIPWEQIQIGYEENCMSPEAADLIKKLLVLDPKERLGTNGADEIKRHPFFKGINWEKLRTQQAPIIPEHKNEIDTSNFVRLAEDLKKKEQENPFNFVPKDKAAVSNRQVAKELLEAASANFSIFNYAALDLDNVRVAEEALKQKEKELNEFAKQELERADRKGIYDDIFDMPN